uniref:Uncharacterized protein n=1 Tax=Medicago truncatula TaxID=3880 RepID=I3STF7_MEDTR|nr:unknown [Medicago truncatula]
MLKTPPKTINSSTIALKSPALGSKSPFPSLNTLLPITALASALVVHTFNSCPKFTTFEFE